MRQLLFRQRAVAAADEAISSMSPVPPRITTVDILLEEQPAPPGEPGPDAQADVQADELPFEPHEEDSDPQEKELGTSNEQEKHQGS